MGDCSRILVECNGHYHLTHQNQELSEERYIELIEKLKEEGPHERGYINQEKERWKDDFCRRHGVRPKFENMDFFVTNVEFKHDELTSSWRIRDVITRRAVELSDDF